MAATSASLLDRLRHQPDEASWGRLVDLYTPLIRGWLRRHEVLHADCDDLVQEVLAVVVRRLGEFEHNQRTGAFRAWLRTITVNCLRDFWRARRSRPVATGDSDFLGMLQELEDPASGLSREWDREHDLHVTRRLLELLRPQFSPATWRAFQRVALDGVPAQEVAAELGVTVNAVFIAKSRVLARLRQEAVGLIEYRDDS
jgi:RNA polymerase sigma-70 factor (ECF subfamily)